MLVTQFLGPAKYHHLQHKLCLIIIVFKSSLFPTRFLGFPAYSFCPILRLSRGGLFLSLYSSRPKDSEGQHSVCAGCPTDFLWSHQGIWIVPTLRFGCGLPGLWSWERLLINVMVQVPVTVLREWNGRGNFSGGSQEDFLEKGAIWCPKSCQGEGQVKRTGL